MTQSGKAPARSAFALAIDVGNTLTRFGLFEGDELASTWCATTHPVITVDEAHTMLREFFLIRGFSSPSHEVSIERAIVSSVVPSITDAWIQAAHAVSASRPLVVGPGLKTGLKMRFDDPGEVGSDRIADMVAAKELFGFPLIVVDFGTTTNFEVLDEGGAFAGGIIAPGLRLSLSALSSAAARLSMVEMKAPASIVGTNTRTAIQSGAVMGEVARIDGLIDMIWQEMGCAGGVVMSGDDASALAALCSHEAQVEPDLTLLGLGMLERLNRRR